MLYIPVYTVNFTMFHIIKVYWTTCINLYCQNHNTKRQHRRPGTLSRMHGDRSSWIEGWTPVQHSCKARGLVNLYIIFQLTKQTILCLNTFVFLFMSRHFPARLVSHGHGRNMRISNGDHLNAAYKGDPHDFMRRSFAAGAAADKAALQKLLSRVNKPLIFNSEALVITGVSCGRNIIISFPNT